jgi:hypothetical protein
MKSRLIVPSDWLIMNPATGQPILHPLIWPADREIPEGYEELEIVEPASRWNRAVCIHCGCSEPIHTEDCVNRPAVADPITDCDHTVAMFYDGRRIRRETVRCNPNGLPLTHFRFCPDCGAELKTLQTASGDETLASRPEAGEG